MIIAELSHNHGGSITSLNEMVQAAAIAGAWGVKVQAHFATDLTAEFSHQYDRVKAAELSWDDHHYFVKMCSDLGIVPICSVYDEKYLPELHKAGYHWLKIGSAESHNGRLQTAIKARGFKVLLSTGGRDIEEIPRTSTVDGIFYCVSRYPHPPREVNFTTAFRMQHLWPGSPWGFSSHSDPEDSECLLPAKAALALGALYVEAHFTTRPRWATKDGKVSLSVKQLEALCRFDRMGDKDILIPSEMFHGAMTDDETNLIREAQFRWRVANDGTDND